MVINEQLNYSRDDVFIISINSATDTILNLESEVYLNPKSIFKYYAGISALYSKTHKYINIDKGIQRLHNIRKELYDDKILDNLQHNVVDNNIKRSFLNIFDKLIRFYMEMIEFYTLRGIFPKMNKDDTDIPSAVKNVK